MLLKVKENARDEVQPFDLALQARQNPGETSRLSFALLTQPRNENE
jgi:hypothetical protein